MVPRRRYRSSSNSTATHPPHCNRRVPDTRARTLAHMHTHCQLTCKAISLSNTSRHIHSLTLISMYIESSLWKDLQIINSTLPHCPTSALHSAPPTTTVYPFTYPVRSCSDCGKAHVDCAALELQFSAPCSRSGGRAVGARGRGGDAVRVFQWSIALSFAYACMGAFTQTNACMHECVSALHACMWVCSLWIGLHSAYVSKSFCPCVSEVGWLRVRLCVQLGVCACAAQRLGGAIPHKKVKSQ